MKERIPNYLTALRFVVTAALLFLEPFTIPFYCVYAVCGALDYLDGSVARAIKAESELGYKLDHIASVFFIIVSTVCFLKQLALTDWLFIWICAVALIKLASIVFGGVRFRIAAFINTTLNKVAKAVFFLFPLWLWFAGELFAFVITLAFLTLACVEEFIINISSKKFEKNKTSIIKLKKKVNRRVQH